MDDGRKPVRRRLGIGKKKAFRDLGKCIADRFGLVSKRYGEVAFELRDEIRDYRALERCEIGKRKQFADILCIISRVSKTKAK